MLYCLHNLSLFGARCIGWKMKEDLSPLWQAALGTLFTWALTAAGSALVFVFSSGQVVNGIHADVFQFTYCFNQHRQKLGVE